MERNSVTYQDCLHPQETDTQLAGLEGYHSNARPAKPSVGRGARLQSDLDFLVSRISYSPKQGNKNCLLGIVSTFRKLQQKKEKHGAYRRDTYTVHQVYIFIPKAASEPHLDDIIWSLAETLLFLLHTFTIATLPGRVAFERQLLGNLQLPKILHHAHWRAESEQ